MWVRNYFPSLFPLSDALIWVLHWLTQSNGLVTTPFESGMTMSTLVTYHEELTDGFSAELIKGKKIFGFLGIFYFILLLCDDIISFVTTE